jgi:photosystem II stability/assembly factor-like uncharacterized protein
MILIGTDDGIYRWYEDAPWPTFHSLQGRSIVNLTAVGGGVIVATDDAGRVWETTKNGLEWREVPRPDGAGRPTIAAIVPDLPPSLLLATRSLALYRRPIGAPVPRPPASGVGGFLERAWDLTLGSGRGGGTAILEASAPPTTPRNGADPSGWLSLVVPSVPATGQVPEIRRLAVGPAGSSWFAAVCGAGLWRTDDAGATWTACPGLPTEVYALRTVPGKAGGLAVATSDGCWMSEDNGQTWVDKSAGLQGARHLRAVEVRPDDPKHVLAGAAPKAQAESGVAPAQGLGFALYESKDAGKSWTQVKRGFPAGLDYDTIDDIRWDPAAPGYAILALASGECWRTRSGGDWWEPISRQTRAARVLCAVA